jgi:hypothetical protein
MKTICLVVLGVLVCGSALAESVPIDVNRLADCIRSAENSKAHPYGIMAHYKTTTPRQACINTINHALKDYNGKDVKGFIAFLGSRYCPTKGSLRPAERMLNGNWIPNVTKLYLNK